MLAAQIEAAKHPPQENEGAAPGLGRAFSELCLASRALWSAFAEELGEEVGLRWGLYYVPTHEDGTLETVLSSARQAAPPIRAEAVTVEGRPAAWLPDEGRVDNRRLVSALARRARGAGVVIQENAPVQSVQVEGGRITQLATTTATYAPDAVLWCAGAWSAQDIGLPPECLSPVHPVAGEMIALRLTAAQSAAIPHVLYCSDVYLVPRERDGEHLLLAGATMEERGFDKHLSATSARDLRASALEVLPALQDAPIVEHWAGLRPATPDDLPVLGGTSLDNFFLATGHFRNGILLTPVTADLMSACVLDSAPVADFGIARFAPASV